MTTHLTPSLRRRIGTALAVTAIAGTSLCATPGIAHAAPADWHDTTLSPDTRADLLAAQMTLEQKVRLFGTNNAVTVPELGIPARNEVDSSLGSHRGWQPTTAFPSGLALAASGDRELATAWGQQTAREDHLLGLSGVAAPTLDVVRSPFWGRQWETFGEDPILSGVLGAAEINGIQSQPGSYALVKHFGVYTQETSRTTLDNRLSERALREVYLRNWKIALDDSQPGAVMCAFAKINGTPACQNTHTLTEILRGEWGWKGYVSSDYNACNEAFAAQNAGVERCGDGWPSREQLLQAVTDGTIPKARFDEMVHRLLRTLFATGVIDNPVPGTTGDAIVAQPDLPPSIVAQGEELAERAAIQGSVLLKNSGSALPLRANDTVAVIGSGADEYITGTGSPQVTLPARVTTILDGITARAGAGKVTHAEGVDKVRLGDVLPGPSAVPSAVLVPAGGTGQGLTAQYFANATFSGDPVATRVDDQVNVRTGLAGLIEQFDMHTRTEPGKVPFPLLAGPGSIRWSGTLNPTVSGTYKLSLTHLGSATLYVDGKKVVADPGTTLGTHEAVLQLEAGRRYAIRIDYATTAPNQVPAVASKEGPTIRFNWTPPSDTASPAIAQAVEVARKATVAVVVVRDEVGEATDRYSLQLPQDQDRLVRAVAAVNPRTIVVSATSGPVLMPWRDQVSAITQVWYPGEAGGKAVAKLLYGDEDFSGKLPVTFPASEEQANRVMPGSNPASMVGRDNGTLAYEEGIFSGYRGYDRDITAPLFTFGTGLSYQQVRLTGAASRPVKGSDVVAEVMVTVKNTSRRTQRQVVQAYVGTLPTSPATPKRQLAGFTNVTLAPGQSQRVRVPVLREAVRVWDEAHSRWVEPKGTIALSIGTPTGGTTSAGSVKLP